MIMIVLKALGFLLIEFLIFIGIVTAYEADLKRQEGMKKGK